MHWGYYCRTCGASSECFYTDPDSLLTAYREARQSSFENDDTIATTTLDVRSLIFLVRHHEHDVWAECEIGVLRLDGGAQPYRGTALPARFGRLLGSGAPLKTSHRLAGGSALPGA